MSVKGWSVVQPSVENWLGGNPGLKGETWATRPFFLGLSLKRGLPTED